MSPRCVHSLPVQEVHEGSEHVVQVGLGLVLTAQRTLDLVEQRRHLTHAVVDAHLETVCWEGGLFQALFLL